jgi:hypothetical protein
MIKDFKQKQQDKLTKQNIRGLKNQVEVFKSYKIQVEKLETLTDSLIDSIEDLDEKNVTLDKMVRVYEIQQRFIETLRVVSSCLDNL